MNSPAFPDESFPGIIPDMKYCIFRVNRVFDGVFEGSERVSSYTCGAGAAAQGTRQFPSSITWKITAFLDCDESASVLPTSQLRAKGTTIVRDDGFAHFIGMFSIVKDQGEPEIEYFQGTMELIGRSGSHQALGEACDEEEHIEGWLLARGERPVPEYTLRLVIVAKGKLAEGLHAFPDASVNRITGTLIQSP